MAASIQSPSGFSYAQAAKGHASTATSHTPPSKVTSGTATPATGNFSELAPNGNWADDVEASVGEKLESRKPAQEYSAKSVPTKVGAVERTKSETKAVNGVSGVSSPEPAVASSTSNTDEPSAPNTTTSSETTWETKSQGSEPAWIAERKERQNHDKTEKSEERPSRKGGKKGDKEAKEPATSKPEAKVVLTEAPLPTFNPWAKRAEEQKARAASVPQPPSKPSPVASPAPANKENSKPQADARKKANSVTSIAREVEQPSTTETKKPQGKRADVRNNVRQNSRPTAENARTASTPPVPRAAQREAQSLPNLTAVPPPVKDEISWPTPDKADKAEDKDRKERPADKEPESTGDADAAEGKPREKTKWTPYAVTPTIVWETEEMNRPRGSGERAGRGGASTRSRGGLRGGPNGSKGDRAPRKEGSQSETDTAKEMASRDRPDVAEREAMPPPPKPSRQSAATGSRDESRARAQSLTKNASISGGDGIAPSQKVTESDRTKSPENLEARGVKIPEPISRQGSDVEPTREAADAARESSKKLSADSKKESRSFEQREWNGAPRGGKRGGRGRGGSREYTNGHSAAQAFVNGHADLAAAFGVPASPSYQSGRGGFGFSQQGRGSWRGSGPRSQSIPIDNTYPQRFATYGPGAQLPPVQTYYPGMYDFGGMPMTAMPYPPFIDHTYLMDMVSTQLEYYFSIDNLLKDMFLRKNMDSQGYVFLDIIANFNRIKHLTQDKELLKAVCLKSDNIDIRYGADDGKLRLRKREGWDQFLLPKEQRDASVQNDDSQELRRPEVPQQQFTAPPPPAYRAPLSAGLPDAQHRRSFDPGYAVNGSQFHPFSPLAEQYGELTNGDDHRGRATKSPIRENSVSPGQSYIGASGHAHHEPDVFPDDQMHILTVVVKPSTAKQPHAASRTFSNGSIDTRSIFTEMEKSNDQKPKTNGEPLVNGSSNSPSISRHASPSSDRSPDKNNGKGYTLLWIKDKEIPTEQYPENSTHEPYHSLRVRALSQREEAATGTCPYDLDVLYQFWSHFLIRNFNNKVYGEFKFFANNDAQERHNDTGLQNLVQFYAKALLSSSPIREHVVKDYVELVKNEPAILQGAAFKQLRRAYRDGALNVKNRKKLTDLLDQEMKDRLDA